MTPCSGGGTGDTTGSSRRACSRSSCRAAWRSTSATSAAWYGNFTVTDNLNVGSADYSPFSVLVPNDPQLPMAGQTITGFLNINPDAATRPSNNHIQLSGDGEQYENWQGVDVMLQAQARRRHRGVRRLQHRPDGEGQLRRRAAAARIRRDQPAGVEQHLAGADWCDRAARSAVLPPGHPVSHAGEDAGHLYDPARGRAGRGHVPERSGTA